MKPRQQCCVYDFTSADVSLDMRCATAEKSKSIMSVQIPVAVNETYARAVT